MADPIHFHRLAIRHSYEAPDRRAVEPQKFHHQPVVFRPDGVGINWRHCDGAAAASRAMKLSQMKADFVSNVSHELRTPLASIRVFGEFLKLGRVRQTDKIQEYG